MTQTGAYEHRDLTNTEIVDVRRKLLENGPPGVPRVLDADLNVHKQPSIGGRGIYAGAGICMHAHPGVYERPNCCACNGNMI